MRAVDAPAQAPPFAAEAEALRFSYGERPALDGLSLQVPTGAIFGLLGPNGSGKSTLLSLLVGLRQPQSGAVRVFGERPSPALRARTGMLFQETSLDPYMTVRETLWLHGRLFTMPAQALRERADGLLAAVGLAERAGSAAGSLSGGLKRRLELARALLPSPDLLLLDEPTTSLDPDSVQALWSHLLEINAAGATILLATNDVAEADRYCHTVAFIHGGRAVAQGTPAELKAGLKRDSVTLEAPGLGEPAVDNLRSWPDVGRLTWTPPVVHVTVDSASAFIPRLFQALGEAVRGVRVRESTLEDAYFDIVGASVSEEPR